MEIPSPEISNYFFLSDMHLQPEQELKQKKVLDFLESIGGSSLIVVVGDLFDYWVPASCSRYKYFLNRLMHISDQKNIYFIKGNRDFFIRKQSVKFGLIDLGYSAIFNVKGLKMFVSHGDIQFSNDSIHKIYSGIIRSRYISFISEFVPRALIDKIGSGLRKHSKGRY
ncbi:MAG: metallophosphoesterase, partial [Planctomycetes bacterium]|nr:metallophosphoesterase [Planctomycetota bacterium]